MSMKILFDQQIFRKQNYGGISRYFTALITGLAKQPGCEVLPQKFISANVYLKANALIKHGTLINADSKSKTLLKKIALKNESQAIAARIKNARFDVFHPTYYNDTFLSYIPKNKPFVLTVHDMIHESYYDKIHEYLSDETKQKLALIPRAHHIIAVSNYTKSQVLSYFPQIDEKKISVIYHGTNFQLPAESRKPAGLPEKYLLFTGIKKHYKNFFWLAETIADYLKQNNIILLCAGGFDFDTYENDFLSNLGLKQHVKHIAVNSDDEIMAVYKYAECFIFPSLSEGFGMPVLEAFACECPVILSNSSCFPEIAGDAALFFEPGNKIDLLQKIDTLLKDKSLTADLVKKGKERAKAFTWEKSVAQHLAVYQSLLN